MNKHDIIKIFIAYPQFLSLLSKLFLTWAYKYNWEVGTCLKLLLKNKSNKPTLEELIVIARNEGLDSTVIFLKQTNPETPTLKQSETLIKKWFWELFKQYNNELSFEEGQAVIERLSNNMSFSSEDAHDLNVKDTDSFISAYNTLPPKGEFTLGIEDLDGYINGGIQRTELAILAAETNGGKTWYLLNSALQNARKGFNVLFVSVETSMPLLANRLAILLLGVDSQLIRLNRERYIQPLRDKMLKIKGNLELTFQLPNIYTINDLEEKINNLKLQYGYDVDYVVLDYADKFGYKQKGILNQWEAQEEMYNDLFRIANEYNVGVLTATQLKVDTERKSRTGKYDQAGSKEKIRAADIVINIEEGADSSKVFRLVKARSANANRDPVIITPNFGCGDLTGIGNRKIDKVNFLDV